MKIFTCGLILTFLVTLTVQVSFQLDEDNFESIVGCGPQSLLGCSENPHRDWFIMFYAPWCGHCKNAKPTFTQFGEKFGQELGNKENELAVGFVDCTKSEGICRYYGVQGFPMFVYLPANHEEAYEFNGARTMENFQKFVQNPKESEFSKQHEIGFTLFKQVLKVAKPYWKQILFFGLILPAFMGYFAAECMTKLEARKKKKQIAAKLEAEKKQKENQEAQALKQHKKQ